MSTNGDGQVTALDALLVINRVGAHPPDPGRAPRVRIELERAHVTSYQLGQLD